MAASDKIKKRLARKAERRKARAAANEESVSVTHEATETTEVPGATATVTETGQEPNDEE